MSRKASAIVGAKLLPCCPPLATLHETLFGGKKIKNEHFMEEVVNENLRRIRTWVVSVVSLLTLSSTKLHLAGKDIYTLLKSLLNAYIDGTVNVRVLEPTFCVISSKVSIKSIPQWKSEYLVDSS